MKQTVISLILIAMIGWAVYHFLSTSNTEPNEEQTPVVYSNTEQENGEEAEPAAETVPDDTVGITRGQIAPDFELQTMDGETVRLSDYRGERVFINFWATWCPPCRAEMPDMQKIHEDGEGKVLAVNLTHTEKSPDDASEFAKELGLTFPILMDTTGDLAEQFNVVAYPTSYMIDSDGRIQFVAMGAMNYDMMRRELLRMK
ncbi:TlpA family protein disulfide reductase [Bhargavaea ginsengi]|uniref:TlpA family protein disulfide reductase n=1 Tax=Bhargavaea ginsengi TaxID=426757 RepID=UPI00203E7B64|nr:TlpA disulfide reductase family protein [Bhargavaea ginsengi]MCM3089042.1 TlpA family protein disulfide reductase [Bhargavaea ginsengi]